MPSSTDSADVEVSFISTHYRRLRLCTRWQEQSRWVRLSSALQVSIKILAAVVGIRPSRVDEWNRAGAIRTTTAESILLTIIEHDVLQGKGLDTIPEVFPK